MTEILRYFAIGDCFEVTVGSEPDGRRSKKEGSGGGSTASFFPDGKIPFDDIVMVGDRKFDIIGGKEYGLHQIGVTYGYAPEGELEEAGRNIWRTAWKSWDGYCLVGRSQEE